MDIEYFSKSLLAFKHTPSFSCSPTNLIVVKESRTGFISCLTYKCTMCDATTDIFTDNPENFDVNMAVTHGIISIGCGLSQLIEFTAVMNIAPVPKSTYLKCQERLNDIYHQAAETSTEKAGKEEKLLAMEKENDTDIVPGISVVADGAWS